MSEANKVLSHVLLTGSDPGVLRRKESRKRWEQKTRFKEQWNREESRLIGMLKGAGIEKIEWHPKFKDPDGPAYVQPTLSFPGHDVVVQLTYTTDVRKGESRMAKLRDFDRVLREKHGQEVLRFSTTELGSGSLSLIMDALNRDRVSRDEKVRREVTKRKLKRSGAWVKGVRLEDQAFLDLDDECGTSRR